MTSSKYNHGITDLILTIRNKIEIVLYRFISYRCKQPMISIYPLFGYYLLSNQIGKIKYVLHVFYIQQKPEFKVYHQL